jgi:ATP-dependent Lon protease
MDSDPTMDVEPDPLKDETYEAPAILVDDAIVFPEMEVGMTVHDPRSVAATTQAFREHNLIVLIPSANLEGALGAIGTLVLLRRTVPSEGAGAQSLWKGLWRVKVDGVVAEDPYVRVRFSRAGEKTESAPKDTQTMKAVFDQIDEFIRVIPGIPSEIVAFLKEVDSPGKLADLCAYSPFFSRWERLDLLRTLDPEERLQKVHKLFEKQLDSLRRMAKATSILECPTCIELADRALEAGPSAGAKAAREFLEHVTQEHPDELMALIAERYGPAFLRRRALK